MSSFCLEVMKQMNMRYESPPTIPLNVSAEHAENANGVDASEDFHEAPMMEDKDDGNL